jgi:cytochrome c-type biogenesis protein CcmH
MIKTGVFILFLVLNLSAIAADDPVEFKNPELQKRYYALIEEIRCLVCQNQSLADSHADLAQDLRNEIYSKVLAGEQDDQIVSFLVERYGDFVLYRPPLTKNTWLLWFGPFVFMLIGIIFAIILIKKQSTNKAVPTELDEVQQQRLTELLKKDIKRDKE